MGFQLVGQGINAQFLQNTGAAPFGGAIRCRRFDLFGRSGFGIGCRLGHRRFRYGGWFSGSATEKCHGCSS
ncbi:MAG: hypothetical protein DYG89_36260 [Caldilinea sp. CFX5]|nr:hypothetical protein [Caldilinea sp. CFX5]